MANCPSCGSPLAGDEIYCLQCGERLVPEEPPQPSFRVPAAIIGAIVLIAVGGVVFALEQVESDAEKSATSDVPVVQGTAGGDNTTKPTDVAAWPASTSSYTVVLAEAPDEDTARAQATSAVATGVPAGVLDSDDYPTLEPGRWILFTGHFDTREAAAEEALRYAAAGFPDARAAFVSDRRQPATSG